MDVWELFKSWGRRVTHIDWQAFHFLRPAVLYLFIPLGAIVLLMVLGNRERKKWKQLVQPLLRPFMFTKGSRWAILLPLIAFVLGMTCLILGAAGPTWEKKESPTEKIQAVVLIALDLSRSMEAGDIQPSRLERGKFKLTDFLDANPRARAGLIAYAGTAHTVLPFTSDYGIIKSQAISLQNRIMPVQGSNTAAMLVLVDTMMKAVIAPSTVLLMTDALDNDDATLLGNWANGSIHKLEVLLLSATGGAPIPGQAKVLSRQDPVVLQNLLQNPKITVTPLTLDTSDVAGIAKRIRTRLVFEKGSKKDDKDWDDRGWMLILPALMIAAFWFRRGWVIQWCVLPLLLLSSCGVNSKHPDWWYGKDYQGQQLSDAGRFEEAAERFEDDTHKAVAYFKAGNYEAAADLFSLDTSAAGHYNQGLALAKMGRYDEAATAFNKAIDLDPALKDKVQENLQSNAAALRAADSINRFDQQSVSKKAIDLHEKKGKKGDSLKTHRPDPREEPLSADTRVKNLPKTGDRASDEAMSNIHRGKEATSPPKDFKPGTNDKIAENILMQRAAADPAEFLHKRFELQRKRDHTPVKKLKNSW